MMFTLHPGVGVELPHQAGMLRFGMSEQQAQWSLSTLADVREAWVCAREATGVPWAFFAEYRGLTLIAFGGAREDFPGLTDVWFTREDDPCPTDPAGTSVVYQDVDLFGYPIPEVEAALTVLRRHGSPNVVLAAEELGLTLRIPAAPVQPLGRNGRKPRHPADRDLTAKQYLTFATLSHLERRRLPVG
jgi:hypothetical protein